MQLLISLLPLDHLFLPQSPCKLFLLSSPQAPATHRQGNSDQDKEDQSDHQPTCGAHPFQPTAHRE